MVVIRLSRTGRKKYPTYRVVAAESSRAVTGKFVAILGHYNPHTKELVLKRDEVEKYLKNGAQPSNTVVKLLQKEGVTLPAWAKLKTKNKPSKQEATEAPATPAAKDTAEEPAVAESAEANAEEIAENVTEAAPEDTAAGEEAQAEKMEEAQEEAGDAAIAEAAKEATEDKEA